MTVVAPSASVAETIRPWSSYCVLVLVVRGAVAITPATLLAADSVSDTFTGRA